MANDFSNYPSIQGLFADAGTPKTVDNPFSNYSSISDLFPPQPPQPKGFFSNLWSDIKTAATQAPAQKVQGTMASDLPIPSVAGAKEALQTGVDVLSNAIDTAATRNNQAIEDWANPKKTKLEATVSTALALKSSLIDSLFAGISAPITTASRLPGVGYVADVVNNAAGVAGVTGKDIFDKGLQTLPLSDHTKTILQPLVDEVGSLVGQIIGFKKAGDIAGINKVKNELATKSAQIETIVNNDVKPPVQTPTVPSEPNITPNATPTDVAPSDVAVQTPSPYAQGLLQKSVDNGLLTGKEEVAGYTPSTIIEQKTAFDNLAAKGPEELGAVLRGEKPLPDNLRAGYMTSIGMEDYLKQNPDPKLAADLVNSPLSSKVSMSGSELGLMQNKAPDSFAARAGDIKKTLESKVKDFTERKSKMTKTATEDLSKIQLSKEDLKFENFLKNITC